MQCEAVTPRMGTLPSLGMQVAFVLPCSMLLVPVTQYRLNLFYPAMMILLGAHYIPFVFLYGMRLFAALTAVLVGGSVFLALYGPGTFSFGVWSTAVALLLFAAGGKAAVHQELRAGRERAGGTD